MRARCRCHYTTNEYAVHGNRDLISRLRRIASALGISLTEVNICCTSLPQLIDMAQKKAHHKPFLWAHLKSVYANVNVLSAMSRLANSGNSSQISKIIAMVNSGSSSNTIEAYVERLLESQIPKKVNDVEAFLKGTKRIGLLNTIA